MRPPGKNNPGSSVAGRIRDSLPTRVLCLVFLINLSVFGAGGIFLYGLQFDANRELAERLSRELVNSIKNSLIREGGPNLGYILRSPLWGNLADSILVDKNLEVQSGVVVAKGIDLNPSGLHNRPPDFVRRHALAAVAQAIEANRLVFAADGGFAVPIADPLGTDNWGGLWYRVEADLDRMTLLLRMLPWFLVSTILLTAGSFLALKRLVLDPVAQLAGGARRVREGDFTHRLPDPKRRDELADLVRSFNSMTAKVSSFNHILSEEVRVATQKARTAEAALMRQRRLAAMGELAAGIAHEINNPLGGLQNAVTSLEGGDLGEERRSSYLRLLAKGLDRIAETVARLRRFTPRETQMSEVDLRDAIDDAIELVRHRAEKGAVRLAWEPPSAAHAIVFGSRTEIGQAILNLFANALDALEEGGTKDVGGPRIEVFLEVAGDGVLLRVRDNGPGVAEEELERVADLFFSTKGVGKGSGLGLALVHNTLEQHGGKVRLSSEAGLYFEVGLWFPAAHGVSAKEAHS